MERADNRPSLLCIGPVSGPLNGAILSGFAPEKNSYISLSTLFFLLSSHHCAFSVHTTFATSCLFSLFFLFILFCTRSLPTTMLTATVLALAASLTTASAAALQGFNYGSTFTDGSPKGESDFQAEFTTAQNLVGTSGFTSARLYTMIVGWLLLSSVDRVARAHGLAASGYCQQSH